MNENLITRTRVTVTLPIQKEDFVEALYENLPDTMILANVFTTDDGDPVSATFYLSEGVDSFDLGLEIGILSNIYTETLEETLELADLGLANDDELKDCVNSLKDIADNYSSYLSDDRMNVIGQNGNDGEHYSGASALDYGEMDDNIGIDAQGQYYIKDESEEEDQDVDYNYYRDNLDYFCSDPDCDCNKECLDEEDCDERATERYSRDTTGGVEFTLPPQEYVYDEEESINVIHSMIMKDPELNKKEDDDSPLGRLFRSFNDFYKKDDNI